jgi:MFS family permease
VGYLNLLRSPFVTRLLLGTLIGRLPSGMAILAIPLVLRHFGASFQMVGVASGTFAIAAAVGGPLLGRLVDRIGQPRVLFPTAALAAAGFLLIGVAPRQPAVVVLGAAIAGACTPPLEPCLRVLWPRIVGPAQLERAYAVDSGAQEIIYVGAPLIVTASMTLVSPVFALWVAALLGLLGVLIVATSAPSREYRAPARSADWLGPLRSRGLILLFAALVGVGFAIGCLNVLVVHYAEQRQVWGGAGGLLALNATGALAGALAYGAVTWKLPVHRRAQLIAAGMAVGYALLAFLPPPPLMVIVMLVTGFFLAPLLTVSFVLVDRLAPPGTTTEAFAWLITVFTSGMAIGAAVVGLLLEHAPAILAASCAGVVLALTILTLTAGGRLLRAAPTPADAPVAEKVT